MNINCSRAIDAEIGRRRKKRKKNIRSRVWVNIFGAKPKTMDRRSSRLSTLYPCPIKYSVQRTQNAPLQQFKPSERHPPDACILERDRERRRRRWRVLVAFSFSHRYFFPPTIKFNLSAGQCFTANRRPARESQYT